MRSKKSFILLLLYVILGLFVGSLFFIALVFHQYEIASVNSWLYFTFVLINFTVGLGSFLLFLRYFINLSRESLANTKPERTLTAYPNDRTNKSKAKTVSMILLFVMSDESAEECAGSLIDLRSERAKKYDEAYAFVVHWWWIVWIVAGTIYEKTPMKKYLDAKISQIGKD